MKFSRAADRLEGQKMFQVLSRAKDLERNGKKMLHFEIGDPDFDTPENIRLTGMDAIDDGHTHYCDSKGLLELRAAAAETTERSRCFIPALDQILVTPGANAQIYYALACIINPGDEVIVPDPAFVSYVSIIHFLGGIPIRVKLRPENDFKLDPDDIKITNRTKMIIVNSPSNPTGAVMPMADMLSIAIKAQKHGVYLMSDEIYARMTYDDTFASPSFYDHCQHQTIIVNGFSKSYAMTGWRLGVCTGPAPLIQKMGLMLETTSSCVSPFIQWAGVEALNGDQGPIDSMMEQYRDRRNYLVSGLNKIPGIRCSLPQGGFYAWVDIRDTGHSSEAFTNILIDNGLAVSPGTMFGDGEGFIRMCFANSKENILNALNIMREI